MRELVLAAAFAKLQPGLLAGLTVASRGGPWDLDFEELPALIQRDGEEEVLEGESGALRIRQVIEIAVVIRMAPAAGTLLSDWFGKVRTALASDPTLGGLAESIAYLAARSTEIGDATAPTHAALIMTFALTRLEADDNPYEPA